MKVDYDEFQAEIARLKRERWVGDLAVDAPSLGWGCRPRDLERERILAKMNRTRLTREGILSVKQADQGDDTKAEQEGGASGSR